MYVVECEICEKEFPVTNDYGVNTCPNCGQQYSYDENQCIDLSPEQLEVLREQKDIKKGDKDGQA